MDAKGHPTGHNNGGAKSMHDVSGHPEMGEKELKSEVNHMGINMTYAKAEVIRETLNDEANTHRGQTHGPSGCNIGNISGCISLKTRNNANHYCGVYEVRDAANPDEGLDFIRVPNHIKVSGVSHMVHCHAHGVSVGVANRRAGMHSVRCSGANPTEGTAADNNPQAKRKWCVRCVKGQDAIQAADDDANA